MGDKYDSPIEDIFESCQEERYQAFLLLGHKGCGKSTELNRLSAALISKGYPVKTIVCSMDLDMFNIVYSDLFILMGEALLEIAKDCGCTVSKKILDAIRHFWDKRTETLVLSREENTDIEAGASAETPGIFQVLNVFAKIKADLKLNEETRKEYRKEISIRSSEWMELLRNLSEEIVDKTGGKAPVIYTFPIGLSYDARFAAMEGYFTTKTLPMIKIETIEGQPYADGIDIIRQIVAKRADLQLFEENVLDCLIQYSGGSLRDLFHMINSAAKRAERRNSGSIAPEDAERALEEMKTSLTRRIEQGDYEFLVRIYEGNKELIENKEFLLKMLQASVVLEYNGKRWHNLHPLVARFFREQKLIG